MHIWLYESIFNTFSQLLPDIKNATVPCCKRRNSCFNNRPMGHIVHQNNNSRYKISFMESYIQNLDNIVELILYKKDFENFSPGILILYCTLSPFSYRMISFQSIHIPVHVLELQFSRRSVVGSKNLLRSHSRNNWVSMICQDACI